MSPDNLPGQPTDAQLLGYAALIEHYGLEVPPPRRLTAIAAVGRKTTVPAEGAEWLLLPRSASYRVPSSPIEHLGVALKHEGVDLRVIAALFARDVEAEMARWIGANAAGIYTRRAWYLYEWMTRRQLNLPDLGNATYIPLLDPNLYLCTERPVRSARHKVTDNLTGVPGFCPLIRRTDRLSGDRIAALASEARAAVASADPAVLRRAVGFLLLNESKGSFDIEGETPPQNRLERWGRIIADASAISLSIDSLVALHKSLFDPRQRFVRYGLRQQGGFVGRHDPRDQSPIPDHISARPEDLPDLLSALIEAYSILRKRRFDPVLTAALIGFGFVFIHPFEDGNGRLHRFLIQKALADTGFNPPGIVLPVSAAIAEDMLGYRAALEDVSSTGLAYVDWVPTIDGNVAVRNETVNLYRYFDATRVAEYLVDRIERTIRVSLPEELAWLHRFDDAKRRLAQVIDMPDRLASLFVNFCAQNGGRLSRAKYESYFPGLDHGQLAEMERAVAESGITELGVMSGNR